MLTNLFSNGFSNDIILLMSGVSNSLIDGVGTDLINAVGSVSLIPPICFIGFVVSV